MDGISYILGLIERIRKVEGVDGCPFLLDFEVVVLEISKYLFLHNCDVWIKQKEWIVSWKYYIVKDIMTWRNFGWNVFQVGTWEGGLGNPVTRRTSRYSAMTKLTAARFYKVLWK